MSSWFRKACDAKAMTLDWEEKAVNETNKEFVKRRFSCYLSAKIETAIIGGYDTVGLYRPSDRIPPDHYSIEEWFIRNGGDDVLDEIIAELRDRGFMVEIPTHNYLLVIKW